MITPKRLAAYFSMSPSAMMTLIRFLAYSPIKMLNYILVKLQRQLKLTRAMAYPLSMTICPGNICNLSCELCPAGKKVKGRKRGMMEFPLFKKLIDECGPYLLMINLFNWGEPLLNPDIFRMIDYAHRYGIFVHLSTNLNRFDEEICSNLLKSSPDTLIVSLFGASQESVEKYHRGNNFFAVIENMKRLISERNRLRKKLLFVRWKFAVNKYNESEISRAKRLAKEIGVDKLEIGGIRCTMWKEVFMTNEEQFEDVKRWLPKNSSYSMYDYENRRKKVILKNDCAYLWSSSVINWNGSVSPCCMIWHEEFDFGNIKNNSFEKVWNNERYQAARRIIRGDNITRKNIICQICLNNSSQT